MTAPCYLRCTKATIVACLLALCATGASASEFCGLLDGAGGAVLDGPAGAGIAAGPVGGAAAVELVSGNAAGGDGCSDRAGGSTASRLS